MLAVERRSKIEQTILKNKSVLVLDLAKEFDVTTETITSAKIIFFFLSVIFITPFYGFIIVLRKPFFNIYSQRE